MTIYRDKKSTLTLAFSKNPVHGFAKPIVTIGICVKNCDASIREALNSVFDQDFPHEFMEIIVVDDGSEDRTLSVALNLVSRMDIRVRVFHSEWMGLGPARNVVVDNANGDYIVWVDGDMILPRDHVRKQVEFMQQNPTVGIAKARYETYPEEKLVAALENIAYIAVDSRYGGKVTSRTLGTGGSIYRVKAIKQVGGFDAYITGVGEDMDAEYRIRNAGWLLYKGTPALFHERRRKTWKDLWDEGFWHGYGVHYIFRKNRGIIALYKMVPPAGFLVGVWYSTIAYKITRRKTVFLLPLQYTFKRIAWCLGFAKGQIEKYKHRNDKLQQIHPEPR